MSVWKRCCLVWVMGFVLVIPGAFGDQAHAALPSSQQGKKSSVVGLQGDKSASRTLWTRTRRRLVARRRGKRAKKKDPLAELPPRYKHNWASRCVRFKISRRHCRKVQKSKSINQRHKLIMKIFAWWKKTLDNTPERKLKQILAKRDKYFHVSRWWWDRYRRDYQFWAMDVIDRLLQPVLMRYPQERYMQILRTATSLLPHKALSRPREVALISRLSRWMKRRPAKSISDKLVRRFSKQIFAEQKCHWWYVVFIASFSPAQMKRVGKKIQPAWCKYRRYYLRSKYLTPAQIGRVLKRINRKYRRITRLKKLGESAQGRPIWGLEVGAIRDLNAPTTLLVGSQHGDEHMGGQLLTHYLQNLMKRYGKREALVRRWLRTRRIWFIPTMNPDGLHFDLLGGVIKWWRYNRRVRSNGEIGVDLNRNWDFKWKKFRYYSWGRIELPGDKPFSEPETHVVRKLSWGIRRLTGILDVHQSGSVLLTPWAYTRKKMPALYQMLYRHIGSYLTEVNRYKVYPARKLYPHQATLGDWGFGRHKVVSLVLELGYTVYVKPHQKAYIFKSNKLLLDRFIKLATDPFGQILAIRRQRRLKRAN